MCAEALIRGGFRARRTGALEVTPGAGITALRREMAGGRDGLGNVPDPKKILDSGAGF